MYMANREETYGIGESVLIVSQDTKDGTWCEKCNTSTKDVVVTTDTALMNPNAL